MIHSSDRMNTIPKYVVSTTLQDPDWANTTVISSDAAAEIRRLKDQPGQDIVQYGFGAVSTLLMENDLLDELRSLVPPAVRRRGPGRRRAVPEGAGDAVRADRLDHPRGRHGHPHLSRRLEGLRELRTPVSAPWSKVQGDRAPRRLRVPARLSRARRHRCGADWRGLGEACLSRDDGDFAGLRAARLDGECEQPGRDPLGDADDDRRQLVGVGRRQRLGPRAPAHAGERRRSSTSGSTPPPATRSGCSPRSGVHRRRGHRGEHRRHPAGRPTSGTWRPSRCCRARPRRRLRPRPPTRARRWSRSRIRPRTRPSRASSRSPRPRRTTWG